MPHSLHQSQSFWHSTLGVSSLAAFIVALKLSLWKFVAVGAAWMVGLFAGASLTTASAGHENVDETQVVCNHGDVGSSCLSHAE